MHSYDPSILENAVARFENDLEEGVRRGEAQNRAFRFVHREAQTVQGGKDAADDLAKKFGLTDDVPRRPDGRQPVPQRPY